jgi:hypothetical protein
MTGVACVEWEFSKVTVQPISIYHWFLMFVIVSADAVVINMEHELCLFFETSMGYEKILSHN